MINGIKVVLSSEELKQHLEGRSEHHASKGGWYTDRAAEIEQSAPATSISNNPAESLAREGERHEWLHRYFAFLASHVIPDEQYQLSEDDLRNLEFISQRGGYLQ